MKRMLLALAVFAATTVFAQTSPPLVPTITSVYPLVAPAGGSTKVTITGTNFSGCVICSPAEAPRVFFGETEALRVNFLSDTELEAFSPPHEPGYVLIRVVTLADVSLTSSVAFLFDAEQDDGIERILIPLFTPPIAGQNGAEFHTDFRIVNGRHNTPVTVYGLTTDGSPSVINGEVTPPPVGSPGRFIKVASAQRDQLWLNLRAYDTSRAADNFGTQIPIPREKDFIRGEEIFLPNVPTDPKFRSTLRLYSTAAPGTITIVLRGNGYLSAKHIELRAGSNEFEPAYAVYTDFPVNVGPIRVEISSPPQELSLPPRSVPPPIWAFISVTNNETQTITTIAP